MAVRVLDEYYLAITLLITIGYQLFFFSIAFSLKFDKLTDFAGGTNFAVLAITTLSLSSGGDDNNSGPPHARQILTSLLLTIWALRLSSFLLFRILKTGTDTRFDDKRDRFFPFLGFWVAQMLWVWIVSLPVTILNSPAVNAYPQPPFGTGLDVAGLLLWTLGFLIESVSDVQKYRFKVNVQEQDRSAVCDVGVFSWSRHPNYFGEIVLQFAIFMLAISPSAAGGAVPRGSGAYAAQYASILGPVFLTVLLLFVSGLTLQERPGAKRRFDKDGPAGEGWIRYQTWLQRTSILIPLPPALYVRLPVWLKRSLLLEFPIYVFDPEKHADAAGGKKKKVVGQDGEAQASRDGADSGDSSGTGDSQPRQVRSESGENLV